MVLTNLVNAQPNLSVIPSIKTLINADHGDYSKVRLICGGGSSGQRVSSVLLSASVCEDVFASSSARQ